MKPRIRKKGKNFDGSKRYILEFTKRGKFKTVALNPNKLVKLLDSPNKKKNSKEKQTTKNHTLREPLINKTK